MIGLMDMNEFKNIVRKCGGENLENDEETKGENRTVINLSVISNCDRNKLNGLKTACQDLPKYEL
jgi:hypothetical protein